MCRTVGTSASGAAVCASGGILVDVWERRRCCSVMALWSYALQERLWSEWYAVLFYDASMEVYYRGGGVSVGSGGTSRWMEPESDEIDKENEGTSR